MNKNSKNIMQNDAMDELSKQAQSINLKIEQSKNENNKFEYSKPSRDELKHYRIKKMRTLGYWAYLCVVCAMSFYLQNNYIFVALVFLVNIFIVN